MKRKIIGTLVCTLLITAISPVAESIKTTKTVNDFRFSYNTGFGDYKICFNCHVKAEGYGDCSLMCFIGRPPGEDCFAGCMYMWFYSDASITIDDWHYEGKGIIYLIWYKGSFEFDEATHTYTIDGDACFCFARGK